MKKIRNWYHKNFENTWHIQRWNNVDKPDSTHKDYDINNKPFSGTILKKGFFGFGNSYEIFTIIEHEKDKQVDLRRAVRNAIRAACFGGGAPEGVYCHRLPYSSKNQTIILNVKKKTLENLSKEGIKKFKCSYKNYYGL